jgi:hypothetical protein
MRFDKVEGHVRQSLRVVDALAGPRFRHLKNHTQTNSIFLNSFSINYSIRCEMNSTSDTQK